MNFIKKWENCSTKSQRQRSDMQHQLLPPGTAEEVLIVPGGHKKAPQECRAFRFHCRAQPVELNRVRKQAAEINSFPLRSRKMPSGAYRSGTFQEPFLRCKHARSCGTPSGAARS